MDQPFLAACLPGLTMGLPIGPGLLIDPTGHEEEDAEETNPEETIAFTKNVTIPSGLLVINFHSVNDIVFSGFDTSEDIMVYATFTVGYTHKTSSQRIYNKSTTSVIFNEVKYIPFLTNPKPIEQMNRLTITVLACYKGDQHAITRYKHKVVGCQETHLHKILKNITINGTGNVLSKRGSVVGEIQFECAATYGEFGYGQSHQLKTNIQEPGDLIKMSMLPRVTPDSDHVVRGTKRFPRKLSHPPFIPVISESCETLDPDVSEMAEDIPLECPSFPLLEKNMVRLNQLKNAYEMQPSRSKRLSFLRKMLSSGPQDLRTMDENEAGGDDDTKEHKPAMPTALALLLNTTKLMCEAPGIIMRRKYPNQKNLQQPGSSKEEEL